MKVCVTGNQIYEKILSESTMEKDFQILQYIESTYHYQKKYTSENVNLLYPLTDKIERDKDIRYLSLDGTKIKIRFIDLFALKKSLNAIIAEI